MVRVSMAYFRPASLIPVVMGVLLWPPEPASACSFPVCGGAYAAPEQVIPANFPALVYLPGGSFEGSSIVPIPDIGLFSADGQRLAVTSMPDPAAPHHLLIQPTEPLGVGLYRLIDFGRCRYVNPSATQLDEVAWPAFNQAFYVSEPAALPTSLGNLTVLPSKVMYVTVPDDSSCAATEQAAVALLDFELPPDASAFGAVARSTLTVDGQLWTTTRYGRAFSQLGVSEIPNSLAVVDDAARSARAPFALCGPDPEHRGLSQGRHHGEFAMHVAGAASDPPSVGFDFELDCGAITSGGAVVAGGQAANSSGGCAIRRSAPRASSHLLMLGALLWLGGVRRVRRRPTLTR